MCDKYFKIWQGTLIDFWGTPYILAFINLNNKIPLTEIEISYFYSNQHDKLIQLGKKTMCLQWRALSCKEDFLSLNNNVINCIEKKFKHIIKDFFQKYPNKIPPEKYVFDFYLFYENNLNITNNKARLLKDILSKKNDLSFVNQLMDIIYAERPKYN